MFISETRSARRRIPRTTKGPIDVSVSRAEGPYFEPFESLPKGRNRLGREAVLTNQSERLMRAAVLHVSRDGYRHTTIANIVGSARVSYNAFYDCFKDKDECILASYARFLEVLEARLRITLGSDSTWEEVLDDLVVTFFAVLEQDRDCARAFLVEVDALGPEARATGRNALAQMAKEVRSWRESRSDGIPGPGELAYIAASYAIRDVTADALVLAPDRTLDHLVEPVTELLQNLLQSPRSRRP